MASQPASHARAYRLSPRHSIVPPHHTSAPPSFTTFTAQKALALNGQMASAHFNLGVALAELGSISEAKRAYGHVVEMEPLSSSGLGAQCNLCAFVHVDKVF